MRELCFDATNPCPTGGCKWAWPKDDPEGIDSDDTACRCDYSMATFTE